MSLEIIASAILGLGHFKSESEALNYVKESTHNEQEAIVKIVEHNIQFSSISRKLVKLGYFSSQVKADE